MNAQLDFEVYCRRSLSVFKYTYLGGKTLLTCKGLFDLVSFSSEREIENQDFENRIFHGDAHTV